MNDWLDSFVDEWMIRCLGGCRIDEEFIDCCCMVGWMDQWMNNWPLIIWLTW